ncbi:MAG: mechanosensitive ion channel family protein [Treponema sp.]|jgi:small-conductance mechanosensitive channel|nr:mechanosensitive ion channel family protein [Treponema sp.]
MRRFSLAACLVFFALGLLPLWGQTADSGEESAAGSPSAESGIFAPEGEGEPVAAGPAPITGVEAVIDSAEELAGELEQTIAPGETLWNYAGRMGIALGIIAVQALIIWVFWRHFFKFITRKTVGYFGERIKPLTIKKLRILSTKQIIGLIVFGIKIVKYIFTVFLLVFTIPVVFALFPGTRDLAVTLFGYIFNPFKNIVFGTIAYIPNLITIAVIIVVTRYVLRALKFFAIQIEREKLVIPGFYADWANPTFNILRVLLYAFTVAIIYPYLPGSDSRIFQGVSVLVGVIFSLGSSSAIGNLVAGLVITYMRPFKIGDRIKINDVTGFVVEKTLMVIRLKTHKNEYVTFPNLMILNSSVVNYHTSSDEDEEGLVLYATVTFGYGTPWQTVQEILINAALSTSHILKNPKPFVLQTALNDFYANYQVNCYSKEIDRVPRIYSELYQHIQEGFRAAGIDMTAPQFRINMPYEDPFPVKISSPRPRGRVVQKQAIPAQPVDSADSGAGLKDAAPEISAEPGPANTRKAPVRRRSKSTPPSP